MLNKNLQEKRSYERIAQDLPVRFRFSDRVESVWAEAQALNISEGGIFIAKRFSLEAIGNVVHLDLWLAKEGRPLRLICQVAWIKRKGDLASGVGLKIVQIEDKHKETYLTYIYQRIAPLREKPVRKIKFLKEPISKLGDKERRSFQILDYIRRFGPVSKAEICKEVNLNAVSVGKFIDEFLKMGLVFDCGLDLSSGGRRAQLFKLNKDFGLILGIEVNTEKGYMFALVTNLALDVVFEERAEVKDKDDIEGVLTRFISTIIGKLGNRGSQVLGIGIGLDDSEIDGNLEEYISREFDLPVVVEEGFHLESFAQMWITRQLSNKSILYIHSKQMLSLILEGDIYKPEKEIEGKAELVALELQDKALALIELLGPDVVYIANRIERELPKLKLRLKEKLKTVDIKQAQTIKVLTADIDQRQAVALGAVSMVMKEVFIGIS